MPRQKGHDRGESTVRWFLWNLGRWQNSLQWFGDLCAPSSELRADSFLTYSPGKL